MSKVDIKNKLDNYIYKTYNLFSNTIFFLNKRKINQLIIKNKDLKDIHKGERCFILGTGPSLKRVDLSRLKDEIIFGVNYLSSSGNLPITPKYYCFYDEFFYYHDSGKMIEILNSLPNTKFFVRTQASNILNNRSIDQSQVYYQHCNLFPLEDDIHIDMSKNMTVPFNVINGCIQSAIYMGFTEIYLLGCDFNTFATLKEEHFYDQVESPDRRISLGLELRFFSTVAYQHYYTNKYATNNNIKIINITEDSLLDAYPRGALDDVL